MTHNKATAHFLATAMLVVGLTGSSAAAITEIFVTRDASIYSDASINELANGSGQYLFAGVTGENNSMSTRRALLYFDVGSVLPVGAVVTAATLRVTVEREAVGTGPSSASLHAAVSGWGEGPSDPLGSEGTGTAAQNGDATWQHAFFGGAAWTTPGGDFALSASASTTLSGLGNALFSAPGMIADINAWLAQPAVNFGWFLLVDETGQQNARRFSSRNLGDEDTAPMLTLDYYVVPEPSAMALLITAGIFLVVRRRAG